MQTTLQVCGRESSIRLFPASSLSSGRVISCKEASPPSRGISSFIAEISTSRSRCSIMLSVEDTTVSTPSVRSAATLFGLFTFATVFFTSKTFFAVWQQTRLLSSFPVTAQTTSARSAPASRRTSWEVPSPVQMEISSWFAIIRHSSLSCSIMAAS